MISHASVKVVAVAGLVVACAVGCSVRWLIRSNLSLLVAWAHVESETGLVVCSIPLLQPKV